MTADDHEREEGLQAECPGSVVSPSSASSLLTEVALSDKGLEGIETNHAGIRDKPRYVN